MTLVEAIVLGLVQGLTEFLPVSSSGHLVMAQVLLDVPTAGVVVEVVLHAATLISVLVCYRQRLWRLAGGVLRGAGPAWRYAGQLALATVPAAAVGLLCEDAIERLFDSPAATGYGLLVTALVLASTRRRTRTPGPGATGDAPPAHHEPPGWRVALLMGLAQAAAILPGVSRSGSTIACGLWCRLDGERAAEFSFLMSLPVVAGAALLQARHLGAATAEVGAAPLAAGALVALVSGVLAIRTLVWLVRRQGFHLFAGYVAAAGALFLTYLALRG